MSDRFIVELDGKIYALLDEKPGYESTICFYSSAKSAKFAAVGLNYAAKLGHDEAHFPADDGTIYTYDLNTGDCVPARKDQKLTVPASPKRKIPVDLSKAMF